MREFIATAPVVAHDADVLRALDEDREDRV